MEPGSLVVGFGTGIAVGVKTVFRPEVLVLASSSGQQCRTRRVLLVIFYYISRSLCTQPGTTCQLCFRPSSPHAPLLLLLFLGSGHPKFWSRSSGIITDWYPSPSRHRLLIGWTKAGDNETGKLECLLFTLLHSIMKCGVCRACSSVYVPVHIKPHHFKTKMSAASQPFVRHLWWLKELHVTSSHSSIHRGDSDDPTGRCTLIRRNN